MRDIRNITAALANVPISYVALGQVAYSPEQAPSSSAAAAANGSNSSASSGAGAGRRLRHNQHAIQSIAIARALAASGDTLVVRSLIAAQTNDAAQTIAANIIADRATASLAVQESLRSYAPLINNVQYSDVSGISSVTSDCSATASSAYHLLSSSPIVAIVDQHHIHNHAAARRRHGRPPRHAGVTARRDYGSALHHQRLVAALEIERIVWLCVAMAASRLALSCAAVTAARAIAA